MAKKKSGKGVHGFYTNVCCGGGTSFWGWFLLALGIFLLGRQMGWIPSNFSLWPPVLIIIGLYLLINYHLKKGVINAK